MEYSIEKMKLHNWSRVRSVYLEGIATGHATFEAEAPDWETFDGTHLRDPRLVAKAQDQLLGWTALTSISNRYAYSGVAEISLYVSITHQREGIGSALLSAMIDASERAGIWTLQGGIFPENTASLALFGKHGFREVGRRERIGRMSYGELAGRWRDVILVERRSTRIETD
jgi:L-amino acid N-acyltransferase YncA